MAETTEEVVDITSAFLQHYRESADYGERTYKWVRRIGLDRIKKTIVEDEASRIELSARMKEALSVVFDPWKEKLGSIA
jgi:nitrite reductase (NADH) large subunit